MLGYGDDVMEPFISRDVQYLLFNDSNAPGRDTDLHYAERRGWPLMTARG